MICPICLKEFTPRHKQRYCSGKCYYKSQLMTPEQRRTSKLMLIEWINWNADFKLGKTVSNL